MVGLFVLTPWPISRSRFFLLLLVGAFFRRGGAERFHGRAEDGPNGLPGQCGGRGGNGRGRGRRQALPKRGKRALFRGNVYYHSKLEPGTACTRRGGIHGFLGPIWVLNTLVRGDNTSS